MENCSDPFMRFEVGQPVRRTEDPQLLRGQGRYTDDVNEPRPAVAAASAAATPGAPQLYDEVPGNLACDYHYGDAAKVAEAFARAAHVTKLELRNTRVVNCSIEPRAAICSYDAATQRFTL